MVIFDFLSLIFRNLINSRIIIVKFFKLLFQRIHFLVSRSMRVLDIMFFLLNFIQFLIQPRILLTILFIVFLKVFSHTQNLLHMLLLLFRFPLHLINFFIKMFNRRRIFFLNFFNTIHQLYNSLLMFHQILLHLILFLQNLLLLFLKGLNFLIKIVRISNKLMDRRTINYIRQTQSLLEKLIKSNSPMVKLFWIIRDLMRNIKRSYPHFTGQFWYLDLFLTSGKHTGN